MPELRIILLVAGVLFIAGIATFEWWRGRGSRRAYAAPARDESSDAAERSASTQQSRFSLPEISSSHARVAPPDSLPVIELGHSDMTRAEKPGARETAGIAVSGEVAVDRPLENTSTQAILRAHDLPGSRPHFPDQPPRASGEPYIGQDDEVGDARVIIDGQPVPGPKLALAWPKEDERRIVTLRVMPQREPRFAGRSLRQAFAASGFWHGPLDIFHLPDAEGRVILSAAALAQPGTFDPSIMDSQRFSGLNLFAVLPGPMGERETFEELVHAARSLAERLEGRLADQHGEELTGERIARLRQSLPGPAERVADES
jgi:cell division protein ZipA